MLSACAPHQPAPVVSADVNPLYHTKGDPKARVHPVRRGDTLYSIAWHYGKDVKQLIAINQLTKPYTIYPGQAIYLQPKPQVVRRSPKNPSKASTSPSAVRPQTKTVQNTPVRPTGQSSKKVVNPALESTEQKMYGGQTRQKVDKDHASASAKPATASTGKQQVRLEPGKQNKQDKDLSWQWPVTGKPQLLQTFSASAQGNQGIDIAGTKGTVVQAAAPGEVVYAGAALRGYGRLLIISHQDDYLSAYAHNERLLVKEKDQVKTGQPIAQMGSSGAERVKLHFEIRHQGQPVDPMKLLPLLR